MSGEELVTVGEVTPQEARQVCLAEIDAAVKADSLDHMVMHLRSALIWARDADFTKETP